MKRGWMRGLIAAALLCAPSAAGAQRMAAVPSDASGGAAASVDALLDLTTASLLAQVRMLSEPGREVGDEIIRLPCDRQPQPAETGIARMRPEGIVTAVAWRIRASQTIRRLEQPLSVCFPAGRAQPDRAWRNVIRFNSEWLARHGGSFVLSGYTQPGEAPATLGRDRALWVRQESGANLHRRLHPLNAGCSSVPGEARWVHYVLSTQPEPSPAAARPAACR